MKRYADEPGAGAARGIEMPVISAAARVEVPAALWRKHRLGELSAEDADLLARAFAWDLTETAGRPAEYAVVALGGRVLARAAGLPRVHALRAYDAVQLACAIEAREADPDLATFATGDGRLAEAARREGFTTPAFG